MNNSILVSVIIPCCNEEKFISQCLDSIIANDFPKNNFEILVIDGMSEDKTRKILKEYVQKYSFIRLLENPKKITPHALNIGIKNAKGEIIIRMDAHSVYYKDYISKCIEYLEKYNVDNVGGIWKIMPIEKTLINKAIALASSSFFSAGNAYYRRGYSKGAKLVDTVFGGCYKKEVFQKIGLYNENLKRSQDMEFNLRLKQAGGKILLVPDIITFYYPKSTLREFFKHNFEDGVWAVYPLKFIKKLLKLRHYVPLFFVSTLISYAILSFFSPIFLWMLLFILCLYSLSSIYFSFVIAIKEKDVRFIFITPIVFAARHIGYGLGSIRGLIMLFKKEKGYENKLNQPSSKKKLWIFNHYATKPDEPATRAYDFGKELTKKGHKVKIFASSFSHYQLKEKYLTTGGECKVENYRGVDFVWIKTYPYKKNDWRRAINMLSYAWRAFWISRKLKERPDVIVGTCVHPFAVFSAYLVSKLKKSRFFFEVTDVWPQTIVDMGFMSAKNPLILGMKILEKFLYKKAEKVISLPPSAADYITKLGVPRDKIIWIPNGVDLSRFKNLKQYKGGGPEFIFMYSGIHAKYTGLDTILRAAKILQEENESRLKFIFLGDGPEKTNLIKMAEEMSLHNVKFLDMVPKNKVGKILEKADVFISIIKDIPVLKFGISSNKLNDYLAFGRPIIFAVAAQNNPVEEASAGLTIPPEDSKALVRAVKKIISLKPEERIRMARNGQEYAKKYLDIKVLTGKLEKLL